MRLKINLSCYILQSDACDPNAGIASSILMSGFTILDAVSCEVINKPGRRECDQVIALSGKMKAAIDQGARASRKNMPCYSAIRRAEPVQRQVSITGMDNDCIAIR